MNCNIQKVGEPWVVIPMAANWFLPNFPRNNYNYGTYFEVINPEHTHISLTETLQWRRLEKSVMFLVQDKHKTGLGVASTWQNKQWRCGGAKGK